MCALFVHRYGMYKWLYRTGLAKSREAGLSTKFRAFCSRDARAAVRHIHYESLWAKQGSKKWRSIDLRVRSETMD
jgi:hypothetical protein